MHNSIGIPFIDFPIIQSLLHNNNIVNKPTKRGLPSYYFTNEVPEDSSDKEMKIL